MWLFLIFVAVPIIEIALFIQVGGAIGLLPTLAIVVLTAVIGTSLMRHQGMQALARLQRQIDAGGDPTGPIAHGALILVAGVLLLTPGFFTDTLGLLLLIPAVRERVIAWGAARITVQTIGFGRAGPRGRPQGGINPGPPPAQGTTIETEYEVLDDGSRKPTKGKSGWTRFED
jgi:UPF0716 protein FxsA